MKRLKHDTWRDSLLAILLSCAIYLFVPGEFHQLRAMSALPVVILAIRRCWRVGLLAAIMTHLLARLIIAGMLLFNGLDGWEVNAMMTQLLFNPGLLLTAVIQSFAWAIPGFFARNIHRTLNNRRWQSVWLNVVTATALFAAMRFLGHWLTALLASKMGQSFGQEVFVFGFHELVWLMPVIVWIVYAAILMLLAKVAPKVLLTAKSPFLTSKERSKLLND